MLSWKSYGTYVYKLNIGRDNIPAETVLKVKELLKDGMTDYEKIAALYKYSQKKNRYVSIRQYSRSRRLTYGVRVLAELP